MTGSSFGQELEDKPTHDIRRPEYLYTSQNTGKINPKFEDMNSISSQNPGYSFSSEDIQLFKDAANLLIGKTLDYNGDKLFTGEMKLDDARIQYFPHGMLSYHHMLHTKLLRIENLIKSGNNPRNESMKDSLIDLVNYAAFMYTYISEDEQ